MNLPVAGRDDKARPVKTYGQYCPIARASELLAERWTPIIIRNLLAGCRTFGELLEGAPGISKALLAQRLDLLERSGVLTKAAANRGGSRFSYQLTEMGRELKTVTDAMGHWGARWLEVEPRHVDATYVLWATCRLVDLEKLPEKGIIARIELADRPESRLWMMLRRPHAEICSSYPGRDEDLVVRTDSATLAHWHLRHLTTRDAMSSGRLDIQGPGRTVKAFLGCLRPSPFAATQPAIVPDIPTSRLKHPAPDRPDLRGLGR